MTTNVPTAVASINEKAEQEIAEINKQTVKKLMIRTAIQVGITFAAVAAFHVGVNLLVRSLEAKYPNDES